MNNFRQFSNPSRRNSERNAGKTKYYLPPYSPDFNPIKITNQKVCKLKTYKVSRFVWKSIKKIA